MVAVIWVTNGMDQCTVGYLKASLMAICEAIDGRLGQVVGFWSHPQDNDINKKQASINHGGIVDVALVDYDAIKDTILLEAVAKVEYLIDENDSNI